MQAEARAEAAEAATAAAQLRVQGLEAEVRSQAGASGKAVAQGRGLRRSGSSGAGPQAER